ncbi:hypothetical protein [Cohnella silvisoli]|uniref:SLH domain-containing protein n=1 Tax=Cohnella silvisoli TaxID=2873699 RepID=A0ABV1KPZ5_9BACL|nr:hypothetical protein [Cohnella silvisoli]MCD9022240.1 hypothetical protein [Cohnella silvisoli]
MGLGDGKFGPDNKLTTAEALALLEKFLGTKVEKGAGSPNWVKDAVNAAIKNNLIKPDQAKDISTKLSANRGFVFKLSDDAFKNYKLPSGKTIYSTYHSDTVPEDTTAEDDTVTDGVYSEEGAGTAP